MAATDDSTATCPSCGATERARRLPLFVVTGASGSGKTTVFGPLADALHGNAVVFDVDWILDSAAAMCRGQDMNWDALRDTWLAVAHGAAQSGLVSVLLGPFIPEHLDHLPARQWIGDIAFLNLDCPDHIRRTRLEARPGWRARDIDEQVAFGQWLRGNISDQVDTHATSPDGAARGVADWVRHRAPGKVGS